MACGSCGGSPAQPGLVRHEALNPVPGLVNETLDDSNSSPYPWAGPVMGMTYYMALTGHRYRVWEPGQVIRVASVDIAEFSRLGYIEIA